MAESDNEAIAQAKQLQAQADKAKQDIENVKKKIAEQLANIEKARKAADKIRELNEIRKQNGLKKGIAALVVSQAGLLKGILKVKIEEKIREMLNKFINQCPPKPELEKLIKIKDTLSTHVTGFENRINKFKTVTTTLNIVITVATILLEIIKSIPLPTAIIPPQVGGVGIPISTLTRFSDKIVKADKIIGRATGEVGIISGVIEGVAGAASNIKRRLDSLDQAIQACSIIENSLDPEKDLAELLNQIQPPKSTQESDEGELYKGFKLTIQTDPNSPRIAPRRYAIARDRVGVVALYGPTSFSSSTQVLIDELKFIIDNRPT